MLHGVAFGVGFAAVAVGLTLVLPRHSRYPLLALLLTAAAAVYVGGALGEQPGSAALQAAAFVLFTAFALGGWQHPAILAGGWLAHTAWDLLHLAGMPTGLPHWYQLGCVIADILIAAFLLLLGRRSAEVGLVGTATSERASI